jgi:hypothetical protein
MVVPYKKLLKPQTFLRPCRLLFDLTHVFADYIYADIPFSDSLDGVFVLICVAIGHAENRPMNVSKLSHYIGMSRQTVLRRLNELISRSVVERTGMYYYIASAYAAKIDHLIRTDKLIAEAFRDMQKDQ